LDEKMSKPAGVAQENGFGSLVKRPIDALHLQKRV
jgi:hypothetical protein